MSFLNGRQQWRQARSSPICFASDASLQGFGFYIESLPAPHEKVESIRLPDHLTLGTAYSGRYADEHANYHDSANKITWCELLAVVAIAATYGPHLQNRSLLFYVDNSTDVSIINRQATRSALLAELLRRLYFIALQNNLDIRAEHRPGVSNTLADFLSRPDLHRDNHCSNWARQFPSEAHRLRSVCVVSSRDFYKST
jgi:hypothetical protein